MDYIKLINRFWEANRNTQFTMAETTLYFYLLNEANPQLLADACCLCYGYHLRIYWHDKSHTHPCS